MLLPPIFFSLVTLTYYVPYRYEYLLLFENYSSVDALLLSLVYSVLMLVETYVTTISLSIITVFLTSAVYKAKRHEIFKADLGVSVLDLGTARAGAALIISISAFILALIPEVKDTVSFLASNIDSITLTELLTIMANYLLFILLLVLSYTALVVFSTEKQKNI